MHIWVIIMYRIKIKCTYGLSIIKYRINIKCTYGLSKKYRMIIKCTYGLSIKYRMNINTVHNANKLYKINIKFTEYLPVCRSIDDSDDEFDLADKIDILGKFLL